MAKAKMAARKRIGTRPLSSATFYKRHFKLDFGCRAYFVPFSSVCIRYNSPFSNRFQVKFLVSNTEDASRLQCACSRHKCARIRSSAAHLFRDLYVLGLVPAPSPPWVPSDFRRLIFFRLGLGSVSAIMAAVPTASAVVEQRWQTLVAEAQTAFLLACTLKQAEPSAHASNEQFFSVILHI
jgi:hypothetical protein